MKKPCWLKGSYIQFKITFVFFSLVLKFQKSKKKTDKVLITSFGGLGDIIVRQKLIDLIAKKYGKENIRVLVKNNPEVISIMGYESIYFKKNTHKNIFKLVKLYNEILKNGFKRLYLLETMGNSELYFLKYCKFEEIMGYECEILRKWEGEYKKVLVPTKKGKVLDVIYEFAKNIDENSVKNSLVPSFDITKNNDNYISVGVGASGKSRISSPKKLGEFLNFIKEKDLMLKFHLLGNGKIEREYGEELKKIVGEDKIINKVGTVDLLTVIKEIANSKMYIGFDSGLYNMAYALNKKIILLASRNESSGFYHECENIAIIFRNEDKAWKEMDDSIYKNREMNGIHLDSFIEAYKSFEERNEDIK